MNTPISLLDVLRDNERLQRENARLIEENMSLKQELERLKSPEAPPPAIQEPDKSSPMYTLSSDEKVALFRSVFRGRDDVFARRWHSSSGKSGYQPVCANEWRPDLCDKKQYKCSECPNRQLSLLTDRDIFNHLAGNDSHGRDVVGLFPLLEDNTCYLLCADFDDKNSENGFKDDVLTYKQICSKWHIRFHRQSPQRHC